MAGSGAPEEAADVLVIFGITGDLARVMTFRSLYRLELRGLLRCPVVGVAVELREHARESIEAAGETIDETTFMRFAARLAYVRGDFADSATLPARILIDRPDPAPLADDPSLESWRAAPSLPDLAPALSAWRGIYAADDA